MSGREPSGEPSGEPGGTSNRPLDPWERAAYNATAVVSRALVRGADAGALYVAPGLYVALSVFKLEHSGGEGFWYGWGHDDLRYGVEALHGVPVVICAALVGFEARLVAASAFARAIENGEVEP